MLGFTALVHAHIGFLPFREDVCSGDWRTYKILWHTMVSQLPNGEIPIFHTAQAVATTAVVELMIFDCSNHPTIEDNNLA